MTKNFLAASILIFLLSPYLVLLIYFAVTGFSLSLPAEFGPIFIFTFEQALFSSIAALVFGVIASFGLLALQPQSSFKRNLISVSVLLPSTVPVLFVILAALNLAPSLSGMAGIILLHALINLGLVAVTFEALIRENLGRYVELAQVEGASRVRMLAQVVFPILKRDILVLWLAVFAFCFSSFAIPLIIGGSQAATTEVLIYKLLRIDQNWGSALMIAICQASVILMLSIFITSQSRQSTTKPPRLKFLSFTPLSAIAFAPTIFLAAGLLSGVFSGFSQLFDEISFSTLVELIVNSTLISLTTASLTLACLSLLAIAQPSSQMQKWIRGLVAPSSVLTGFAILILWRAVGFASLMKVSIGLTLIFVPSLYRLGWELKVDSLKGQIQTANVFGASRLKIFSEICWPQLSTTAARLIALASFWAWGEFALTKIISERTLTVSLLVQSLISSYRLNSATALLWLMFLASAITSLCVWGLVNVASRKSTN